MPVDVFAHTFAVSAPPAAVYEHLTDPESYIGLSPLVVSVQDVHRDGDVVTYVAVEKFRFYRNPIRVTMTLGELRVVSDVVSPGRVRLRAAVDLAPHDNGGTQVTETITVDAPALLRRYVLRQARKVQQSRARVLTHRMR